MKKTISPAKKVWTEETLIKHIKYLDSVKTRSPHILKEVKNYWLNQLNIIRENNIKKQFDRAKLILNKSLFNGIYPDYDSDSCLVRHKVGSMLFEFTVFYDKKLKYYSPQTYDSPEEFEVEFKINDVIELYIYGFKNKEIEFSDKQFDELTEILKNKLIGKIIN